MRRFVASFMSSFARSRVATLAVNFMTSFTGSSRGVQCAGCCESRERQTQMLLAIAFVLMLGVLIAVVHNGQVLRRETYLREYVFPKGLYEKLRQRRPELSHKDCALVSRALRQFFLVFAKSRGRFVAMPSQVADDLWHEFILHTRNYERFCLRAFGRSDSTASWRRSTRACCLLAHA